MPTRCSSRRIWTTSCSPAAAWPPAGRCGLAHRAGHGVHPVRRAGHRVRAGVPARQGLAAGRRLHGAAPGRGPAAAAHPRVRRGALARPAGGAASRLRLRAALFGAVHRGDDGRAASCGRAGRAGDGAAPGPGAGAAGPGQPRGPPAGRPRQCRSLRRQTGVLPRHALRDPPPGGGAAADGSAGRRAVPIGAVLDRKIAAAQAYASQIGFQFGGPAPLADALRASRARRGGMPSRAVLRRRCGCASLPAASPEGRTVPFVRARCYRAAMSTDIMLMPYRLPAPCVPRVQPIRSR